MAHRDGLKQLGEITQRDPRQFASNSFNPETGEFEPKTLEHHYAEIEQYNLNDSVPEDVATQYDVARNIYIYAWFEYRLYNVAEAKALSVLEFSLKKRIGEEALKTYIVQRRKDAKAKTGKAPPIRQGLRIMMEYCRDHGLVDNRDFSAWNRRARMRAYDKAESEQIEWAREEMERTGKTEILLPELVAEEMDPDESYDFIDSFVESAPDLRNCYAHGSKMLHKQVLPTFEKVSEFINQIYSREIKES